MNRILLSLLLLGMAGLPFQRVTACSTILAGKHATADGSPAETWSPRDLV